MNIDLAALPDDVGALQQLVRSLAAERTSLREAKAEIERLNLIIKQLQRHQFGRRAERLDNDQRMADKDASKREDDLTDAYTYGLSISLGDAEGW